MRKNKNIPKSVGIIISTYNNPTWLEKALWGYECQNFKDFEIIIADDGSTKETYEMVDRFRQQSNMTIKYIWQEDNGFQKCRILNKAILSTKSEYLIFTDQDCIPRQDFVKTHVRYSQKGFFLSAGYFRLPFSISQGLTNSDITDQKTFNIKWLMNKGLKPTFKCSKLINVRICSSILNYITPANASWNGCNSSGWRCDFMAVNGFNEKMQYGGEDREFGERLFNCGIKSKQIRYSAICVHLDHKRPYKNKEAIIKNRAIRKQIRRSHQIITLDGLSQYL
jgi:Glycosyltransferases involved in cell wall biogenesis